MKKTGNRFKDLCNGLFLNLFSDDELFKELNKRTAGI